MNKYENKIQHVDAKHISNELNTYNKKIKCDIDFSEYYLDTLNDYDPKCILSPIYDNKNFLISGDLKYNDMYLFVFECFNDNQIVQEIWQIIKNKYFKGQPYNIHKCLDYDNYFFDEKWWDKEYPEISIYINENIILKVNINIFFTIDWNANQYNYDAYCLHNYTASVLHIEKLQKLYIINNYTLENKHNIEYIPNNEI